MKRIPFHYKLNNKETLLVTIGDSWTWGDSLGKINASKGIVDDYEHRTASIYGYHLSLSLDCDWLNYAVCGIDNITVLSEAIEHLSRISDRYSKIYVVVTLTESGRELNRIRFADKEAEYNLIQGPDWPKFNALMSADQSTVNKIVNECYSNSYLIAPDIELAYVQHNKTTALALLKDVEKVSFHFLSRVFGDLPNTTVFAGRNFTNTFPQNTKYDNINLLPLTWTNIIALNGNIEPYPTSVRVVSDIGLTPLLSKFDKEQLVPLIDDAIVAINWLHDSPFNAKIATKHPLEQAHKWWAEYIYNNIIDKT